MKQLFCKVCEDKEKRGLFKVLRLNDKRIRIQCPNHPEHFIDVKVKGFIDREGDKVYIGVKGE